MALVLVGGCGGGGHESATEASGWRLLGPPGGAVLGLLTDPERSGTVYAASYDGVFKSIDAGGRWSATGTGLGDWMTVALAPSDPETIYAGNQALGVLRVALPSPLTVSRSTDGGETWTRSGRGIPVDASIAALAVDPSDADTVYAGTTAPGIVNLFATYHGIFKTTDGGRSWRPASEGLAYENPRSPFHGLSSSGYPAIRALTINAQTLYAATTDGVVKSSDGARSWAAANRGLGKTTVEQLVVSRAESGVVYAATKQGLFRTSDGQAEWTRAGSLPTEVWGIAADPTDANRLYAATPTGVFRSGDGGAAWTRTALRTPATAIAVDAQRSRTIYAGTLDRGVLTSADAGATWRPAASGFTATVAQSVVVDPRSTKTLYLGTGFGGVFKSTDGGQSWHEANTGLPSGTLPRPIVAGLGLDPQNPGRLYASTSGESQGMIFQSDDGGASWREASLAGADLYKTRLDPTAVVDPQHPQTLYHGSREAGVSKSDDGGTSWNPARMGLPCDSEGSTAKCATVYALTLNPKRPHTLYAATAKGVFKSTDAAANWHSATQGLPGAVRALVLDPRSPSTLYASTASGVYRSDDAAGTWSFIGAPTHRGAVAVAVDPDSSTLYAVTAGGLYARTVAPPHKTTGGGSDLTARPEPTVSLAHAHVHALALDPRNPQTIYAGSYGVFRSSDGGRTWRSAGLKHELVLSLTVDPTRPETLYAATSAGDVFKSTNAAKTWKLVIGCPSCEYGHVSQVAALVLDREHPQTLYAGAFVGIFKSTNGGATWAPSSKGLPAKYPNVKSLAIDPRHSEILYAGAGGDTPRLFKSTDGGANWKQADNGLAAGMYVDSLAIDPHDPQTVYAGTVFDAYRSTDGGASWHAMHANDGGAANPVAIDPGRPQTIYAVSEDEAKGLLRSTNSGLTWHPFGPRLRSTYVISIAVIPQTHSILLGTQGGGMLILNPDGSTRAGT